MVGMNRDAGSDHRKMSGTLLTSWLKTILTENSLSIFKKALSEQSPDASVERGRRCGCNALVADLLVHLNLDLLERLFLICGGRGIVWFCDNGK